MRRPRAFLALLIAAALLGAGGAEAARTLPSPAPAPALDASDASAVELLAEPAAETVGAARFRLTTAEDFSLLTAIWSSSTPQLPQSTQRAAYLREEKKHRLFLASRLDLQSTGSLVTEKPASRVLGLLGEPNVWETWRLSQDSRRPTFQGLWTDPVTGLCYARNRWYDPKTASWLSEDSYGNIDSENLYAFVGWQPHMATDPMGEFVVSGPVLIGSLIVAGFATWEAGNQIDRSTDIDPHANMLAAGLIGGGRVVVGAGVAYATFGLGTAALGVGVGAGVFSGAAAGGTGLLASDAWGVGWGVQEGFSSPGAYAFAVGTGGVLGGAGNLLAGRAPYTPSRRINLIGQRSAQVTAGARQTAAIRAAAQEGRLAPRVASNDYLATPGRLQRKLASWKAYQEDPTNAGWDMSRWSRNYDALQRSRIRGKNLEAIYHRLGLGSPGRRLTTGHGLGDRIPDAVEGMVLREIKSSRITLSRHVRMQILKDVMLSRRGYLPEWHLHGGASQSVIDMLSRWNIPYYLK